MRRSAVNLLIDVITLLVFFAKVWTGCLMHYVLPAGGGRGHTLTLWGMNRHDYGNVHFYLALAMVALIIVHLWLHWPWVCSIMSNLLGAPQPKRFKRALYGMTLLLVIGIITAGSLLWSETKVKYTYGEDQARYGYEAFETDVLPQITGRTTLSQAAEMAGISVEQVIKMEMKTQILDKIDEMMRAETKTDTPDLPNWVLLKRVLGCFPDGTNNATPAQIEEADKILGPNIESF